jgi:hypothetical protein
MISQLTDILTHVSLLVVYSLLQARSLWQPRSLVGTLFLIQNMTEIRAKAVIWFDVVYLEFKKM